MDLFKFFEFKEVLFYCFLFIICIIVIYCFLIFVKNGFIYVVFFDDFFLLLERLVFFIGCFFLVGDFNFYVNDLFDNIVNKFFDFLSCFNLEVCNVYILMYKNNNVFDFIIIRFGEEIVLNLFINDLVIFDYFVVFCILVIKRLFKVKFIILLCKLCIIDLDNLWCDICFLVLYNLLF